MHSVIKAMPVPYGSKLVAACQGVFLNEPFFPPATCGAGGAPLPSKKYLTLIKLKGLRSRIRRLTKYQSPKHVETTLEFQLTTFQQRQAVLPHSSISNNCHVFMYLSPIDSRFSDIKEVPSFQPLYLFFITFMSCSIFSDKVTHCKSLKNSHSRPY